ncbi:MAG: hypothetical protein EBS83_02585 [Planctomycetia bacterium]|jgi:hypothetical protein|nr:hypothetical protein [Planctomycetia bacterium]
MGTPSLVNGDAAWTPGGDAIKPAACGAFVTVTAQAITAPLPADDRMSAFSVKLKDRIKPVPPGDRMSQMSTSGKMKTLAFHLSAPRKVGQDARAFRAISA